MKSNIILSLSVVAITLYLCACANPVSNTMISTNIKSVDDVKNLFLITPEQITSQAQEVMQDLRNRIDAIVAISDANRAFENTAKALDDAVSRSDFAVKLGIFEGTQYLHPDAAMREAAHIAVQNIRDLYVDVVSNNKKLYNAFKAYVDMKSKRDALNDEERYFLTESMESFKRAGLDLPDDKLAEIGVLTKQLSQLSQQFERNIAEDKSTVSVYKEGLAGLDDEFIASLKMDKDGSFILGIDYPTFFKVMENCEVEDTRKRLSHAFSNRAYPKNDVVLKKIITLRDQLAHKLGYVSFGHLNLANQMVKTPENAEEFLNMLLRRAEKKENQELDTFTEELPESVALNEDGKIKPWDMAFLKNKYKQKHFDIDEQAIAEYFPMQKTIDALLDIYHQFLGVHFKEVSITGMWHEDVRLVEVTDDANATIGYLFLDLYPRPNKYSHAAHLGIVPAIALEDGSRFPAMSIVMANFPKPSGDKPSLLKRDDVKTFFHEFGHALHAMLGATQFGSFAGTHTKTDFVELPSQMLEEWLYDPVILKKVSSHYKTGKSLPDDVIGTILELKKYDSGSFVRRQAMLSFISLNIYKDGENKDPHAIILELRKTLQPRIALNEDDHMYASFGHLTGYGSKYYGYLWSKVFALDLFDTIKKHGLLNPEIGKQYIAKVIGKGGSKDPNVLLKDFLQREPNQDAFFKDLGL